MMNLKDNDAMDISYFAHRPEHCLLEADTSTLRLANTSFFND